MATRWRGLVSLVGLLLSVLQPCCGAAAHPNVSAIPKAHHGDVSAELSVISSPLCGAHVCEHSGWGR